MKYTVGYQWQQSGAFIDEIIRNKESIYEVYFSYGQSPSGRGLGTSITAGSEEEYVNHQLADLEKLSKNGI